MAALLPEAAAEQHVQLAEDYKHAFWNLRAAGRVEEPLFDGVLELLDALEARRMAACGRDWQVGPRAEALPRAARYPRALHVAADSGPHPSKPHPSMVQQAIADAGATPETTFVVGDTSFDMAMAAAAGARRSARHGAITRPTSWSRQARSLLRSSRWTCSTWFGAMSMDDDAPWRKLLLAYSALRAGGLADLLPRPSDHLL